MLEDLGSLFEHLAILVTASGGLVYAFAAYRRATGARDATVQLHDRLTENGTITEDD